MMFPKKYKDQNDRIGKLYRLEPSRTFCIAKPINKYLIQDGADNGDFDYSYNKLLMYIHKENNYKFKQYPKFNFDNTFNKWH